MTSNPNPLTPEQRAGRLYSSARQRVVVLTFATPEDAAEWDAAGQPLSLDATGAVDIEVADS